MWEVIENGATLPITKVVEGVITEMPITIAEEKAKRRLENTQVVVWRNKADSDTMRMDDLYKNLKVYEPEVKGMSSSSSSIHNIAFVSSPNNNTTSTNRAVNTAQAINTRHGVSTTSTQVNVTYSTNIDNLNDSDQAEEGPNYALMDFSSSSSNSKVSDDSTCLKSCLETVKLLKSQNDQLLKDLKKYELTVLENYKAKSSKEELKVVRKNDDVLIIEEWVSNNEEKDVSQPKIKKKIVRPNYEEIDEGYVAFVGNPKGGKITGKCTIKTEAVNTACYVQNRVLVVKPHNKTPYEPFHYKTPTLSFMRPFGCPITILNTIDHLGKFNGKADEGTQSNGFAGTKASNNAGQVRKKTNPVKDYILLPLWTADLPFSQDSKSFNDDGSKPSSDDGKKVDEYPRKENEYPSWIEVMQEELLQFKLQEVWTLVDLPNRKRAICTKWVFKNKMDERRIMIRNKAKLVAQEYTQEEGIDYEEVFALIARIEATRLFLAYASFKNFLVYQMDVKSAFLYGKIKEEMYLCQPPGFEDLDFPDRVYKVKKALYGLHQALRTWYETLLTYLLDNGFQKGKINKTLFIKRHKGDILLVQVYVDDIIFGSTKKELCFAFEKLMHEKFQMSSIRELTFFLGLRKSRLQAHIWKLKKNLLKDKDGKEVDVHMYRLMIGSLMHLTSSRPDIMVTMCACARYQVNLKSTSMAKNINVEAHIHAKVDGKKIIVTESSVRRDRQLADEEAGGPRCQETIRDTITQTRFERVSKNSNDLLLARGNTLRSDDDKLKLDELMGLCTTLQNRVLDLEKTKITQHNEIASLKRRVKKLVKRNKSRTHKLKRLYKVGLTARVESSGDEESLEVVDATQVSTATTIGTITTKDFTLAQALEALKTSKLMVKGIVFQEPEHVKPKKRKDQIRLEEYATLKLQSQFDEEERLAREKAKKEQEASIALIETWDDIQVKIDANHELAKRLQAQEQEKLSDAKKATLFQQLEFKRVNTFEDFRTMLVEGKEKIAGEELIQEITKKQKVKDNKENAKLKRLMETILDEEEVAIDAIPLAVKEDLEDLYKLVKARYGSTRLVEIMDYLFWSDMKTLFKPHVKNEVWKMQQGYKVLEWKLYDSSRVHSLMMQSMQIYMLVEKKYPLTPPTHSMMLERKLQIDYESKMAYQLCKLIKKQLKK
uniref:Retrovirus-related Pol polyprotein from transposon TNT 1-94 n=1 Tax=Tanacetum cinerariifolium TaxID=118510 RepID=A0A6L2J7S3_TANCI|nr:retrovirus-related Pol polyprotein from transposon TNT 1-94 [Tanacetum cinerariifolium]